MEFVLFSKCAMNCVDLSFWSVVHLAIDPSIIYWTILICAATRFNFMEEIKNGGWTTLSGCVYHFDCLPCIIVSSMKTKKSRERIKSGECMKDISHLYAEVEIVICVCRWPSFLNWHKNATKYCLLKWSIRWMDSF